MRKFVILACLVVPAASALAEDAFVRPEGCERLATIQYDNCEVDNRFRCEGTGGESYRTESHDSFGLYYVWTSSGDDNGYGVYSNGDTYAYSFRGHDFEDALKTGRAVEQFDGTMTVFGMRRPFSGETVYTFDGEVTELSGLVFQMIMTDDRTIYPHPIEEEVSKSVLLWNEEADILVTAETAEESSTDAPFVTRMTQLSLPGQVGFGDEVPRYGCGVTSQLALPAVSKVRA